MRFLVFISLILLFASVNGFNRHRNKSAKYNSAKENAFVRIHIQDPQIVNRVASIQKQLVRKSQQLKEFFQAPKSLHITIITTAIDNLNLESAIGALESAVKGFKSEFLSKDKSFQLSIKGLSSFGQRVLIGTISDTHALSGLNRHVMKKFKDHGLLAYHSVGHSQKFHPHMSIVNIKDGSKEWLGSKWDKMLDSSMNFGTEKVDSIEIVKFHVNPDIQDYNVLYEVEI